MTNRISRSAGGISLATFVSRILGYLRDMLIAGYFGTGIYADAFIAAFQVPNLLRRLLGEGALSVSFLPVFTDCLKNEGEAEARQLVAVLSNILLFVLLAVTLVVIIFAPLVTRILVPGFAGISGKLAETTYLLRIVFPYIIFVGMAALFAGTLNALRHFAVPAIAPIILNISLIMALVLFVPRFDYSVRVLAWAVLVGGAGQLFLSWLMLRKKGVIGKPRFVFRHRHVKRILILMFPAAIGLAVYHVNIIADRFCASFSSIVGTGAVSALYYGNRLMQFPLALFGITLGTVVFPVMAAHVSENNLTRLSETVNLALRMTMMLIIPAAVGLMVLRRPIVRLLFERGEFTVTSTNATSAALLFYSIGLFAYAGIHILSRAFYSLQDTRTPVKIACIAMVINIILNVILMWPLQHRGLALATSLAALVNFSLLWHNLRIRIDINNGRKIRNTFIRVSLASLLMGLVVIAATGFWEENIGVVTTIQQLLQVMVLLAVGVGVIGGAVFLLRIEEGRKVFQTIRRMMMRSA